MTQHPYVVNIRMTVDGYEKHVPLVGEAFNADEAATAALAAEAHNELEDHPYRANTFIDDSFTYIVHSAERVSYDDYQVLKQHMGAF